MPSEHNPQSITDSNPSQHQRDHTKPCPECCALVVVPDLDALATCPNCRGQVLLRAVQSQNSPRRLIDQDLPLFQPSRDPPSNLHNTRRPPDSSSLESPPASPVPLPLPSPAGIPLSKSEPPTSFSIPHTSPVYRRFGDSSVPPTNADPISHPSHSSVSSIHQPHSLESQEKPAVQPVVISTPDPLMDITRMRVRTRVNHCLYPGATFKGTQKSGRNSYDVTVTIVDVDFATSFLCGYLCIRGLTDDWPELTTYFDAEIIGSRHGFLTQNWGASENEDLVHWSRFPAFRHIKHEAKRPRLTIDDRDRGAVFMRWKERFLVPDHRVQDINGASFAGFYYVCVDFNPAITASANGTAAYQGSGEEGHEEEEQHRSGRKQHRSRRGSSARRASIAKRAPSLTPYTAPMATMSGFYYHQNSEPYQQLSLTHVSETSSASFEFR